MIVSADAECLFSCYPSTGSQMLRHQEPHIPNRAANIRGQLLQCLLIPCKNCYANTKYDLRLHQPLYKQNLRVRVPNDKESPVVNYCWDERWDTPSQANCRSLPDHHLTHQRCLQGGKIGISLPTYLSAYGANLSSGLTP